MTDYLGRLAARALGQAPAVQPALPARFAMPAAVRGLLATGPDEAGADGIGAHAIDLDAHAARAVGEAAADVTLSAAEKTAATRPAAAGRPRADAPIDRAPAADRPEPAAQAEPPLAANRATTGWTRGPDATGPDATPAKEPRHHDRAARQPADVPHAAAPLPARAASVTATPAPEPMRSIARDSDLRNGTEPDDLAGEVRSLLRQVRTADRTADAARVPGSADRQPEAVAAAPVVRIHIGRVDVRAVQPPAPAPRRTVPPCTGPERSELSDYLARRHRSP